MLDRPLPWILAAAGVPPAEVCGDATFLRRAFLDLTEEQYIALHDGRTVNGLDYIPNNEFVIDRVGHSDERHFADLGIEYYRYVG